MNLDLIYKIRENKDIYNYLKYNSYLYKDIYLNKISIKELERIMKKENNQTIENKLKKVSERIEFASSLLTILK